LCNLGSANPSKRARQVADVFLGDLMKPRSTPSQAEEKEQLVDIVELTSKSLDAFGGDYWSDELRVTYHFARVKNWLRLTVVGADGIARSTNIPPDDLVAGSNDIFRISNSEIAIHFGRDAKGEVNGFTLDAGRTRGMVFGRVSR
jgi:hypothetical protein